MEEIIKTELLRAAKDLREASKHFTKVRHRLFDFTIYQDVFSGKIVAHAGESEDFTPSPRCACAVGAIASMRGFAIDSGEAYRLVDGTPGLRSAMERSGHLGLSHHIYVLNDSYVGFTWDEIATLMEMAVKNEDEEIFFDFDRSHAEVREMRAEEVR